MTAPLTGHTAIVSLDPDGSEVLARRLAHDGAHVIVVSADADAGGRLAAAIEADGAGPAALFSTPGRSEPELDALVELVTELSRRGGGEPG